MSLDRSVILGNQHVSHSMTTIEAWTAAKSKFWISHAAVIEEKERRHEAHCSCSSSKTSTVFLWNALIPSYFEPVFLCLSLILMTWAICVRQKAIKERFALVVPRIGSQWHIEVDGSGLLLIRLVDSLISTWDFGSRSVTPLWMSR